MLPILCRTMHGARCGFKAASDRPVSNHPCEEAGQVNALFDRFTPSVN